MTVTVDLAAAPSDVSTRRTLSELSASVVKSKRAIVVTGAGISCSCGIPDFRSSDGLYNLVKKQYPDVVLKGRDLFDASLFRNPTSTSVFYTFISQLKQAVDGAEPSPTHHFIKTLDSKRRLLRSYTQNIDGLEEQVGLLGSSSQDAKANKGKFKLKVKDVRNVQLHGDIHRVRCITCSSEYPYTAEYIEIFNEGLAPDCPDCSQRAASRIARSARPIRVGTLRPAIVLYDEHHPLGDEIGNIQSSDISRKPDMLIIMGTSLKVHGLKRLVKDFARAVHAGSTLQKPRKVIFVNRTPPGSEWDGIIDYHITGDTDTWTNRVLEDWKARWPSDWEIQKTLTSIGGDVSMASPMKVVKEGQGSGLKTKAKDSKKKARPDDENVPPKGKDFSHSKAPLPKSPLRRQRSKSGDAMVLSTPDDVFRRLSSQTSSPVPLSPSKRRQSTSHYDENQTSPSKKRVSNAFNKSEPPPKMMARKKTVDLNISDEDEDKVAVVRTARIFSRTRSESAQLQFGGLSI